MTEDGVRLIKGLNHLLHEIKVQREDYFRRVEQIGSTSELRAAYVAYAMIEHEIRKGVGRIHNAGMEVHDTDQRHPR